MSESFEWAIKKDVRNNPIVREVDLERHREMWRSVGLSVFLVAVLLFTAWQQFELQQYGYRMEETQELLDEEAVINRRLRLEMESAALWAQLEHLIPPHDGQQEAQQ